jgi:DNA-directed RNA polymerase specialized sigma24 family protein
MAESRKTENFKNVSNTVTVDHKKNQLRDDTTGAQAAGTEAYQIYCRAEKKKVAVSREFYEAYMRKTAQIRMKNQRRGTCCCPKGKIWMCDGDCDGCQFHLFEDIDSLDRDEEEGGGYAEIPDQAADVEKIVETRDTLERVIRKLRKLDKDADRMLELWLDNPDGISDREMARRLGRNEETFKKQIRTIRKELDKIRG